MDIKSIEHKMSREEQKAAVLVVLQKFDIPCEKLTNPVYRRLDALELIDHWYKVSEPWIGAPLLQQAMQEHGIRLGLEAPFMLNAVLAFSATHLKMLYPQEQKYQDAATLHYAHALSGYSSQLDKASSKTADHLFGTCFLMNMLSFLNASLQFTGKKPGADAGNLSWVKVMGGMDVLSNIANLEDCKKRTVWASAFREFSDYESWQQQVFDSLHSKQTSFIPPDCMHHLNVFFTSNRMGETLHNSPYEYPLQGLNLLASGEGYPGLIPSFIMFVGKLPQSFVQLVEELDEQALLILCYWCALFADINQWWITEPAVKQCRSICMYLNHALDPDMRNLLAFPARRCNVSLDI
jgi:hypothetical protein